MEHSESIGKLAASLAAAQAELLDPAADQSATIPGKDGKAGFSYKYADLAGYLQKARPVLGKHGLAITQGVSTWENGITVTTMLLHGDSGEWLRESLSMLAGGNPQSVGGVITYARRYSLAPLLGLATEDDDAASATHGAQPVERPRVPTGGYRQGDPYKLGLSSKYPGKTFAEVWEMGEEGRRYVRACAHLEGEEANKRRVREAARDVLDAYQTEEGLDDIPF